MNVQDMIVFLASLATVSSTTVGAIMALQNSLKNSINKTIADREQIILDQQKQLFFEYYEPLDKRIKNLNIRLKKVEDR